jgi:gluconate 5-dehydrogenase
VQVRELFDLAGTVAIVTGGSRGLGFEMAQGLGEAGASVVVTARRERWLVPAAAHLEAAGVPTLAVLADVSSAAEASRVVAQALERFGRVDTLVNNAGISWGAPAETMPLDKWNDVLATNVTGAFLMAQAVVAPMRQQGGGSIINVASVAGLVGTEPEVMDAAGYSASKGALISLTRDLAVKWARHGIRVNAMAPGFFPTRMSQPILEAQGERLACAIPMGRTGRDDEVKGVAVFLASRASQYVTGQVLAVDGGLTAV